MEQAYVVLAVCTIMALFLLTTMVETPRKMTLTVHCTSYGIVGSGGAVKIYDDGVSASTSYSNSFYASPARSYSGYMLWYNVSAWLDVTTSEGNFFTVS